MDKKAAIIIRCYNKLEFTIRTIQSIIDNTEYENYEIIVVDNKSDDGTEQWLRWITSFECDRYKNLKAVFAGENLGDWGGMRFGFEHTDADYILQVDNDCEVPKGWLKGLVFVLENTKADSVMLKRTGVKNEIPTHNDFGVGYYMVGYVPFNVFNWITTAEFFDGVKDKVIRCRDIGKFNHGSCLKIKDLTAHHMDGYNKDDKSYLQLKKYPKGAKTWQKFS